MVHRLVVCCRSQLKVLTGIRSDVSSSLPVFGVGGIAKGIGLWNPGEREFGDK